MASAKSSALRKIPSVEALLQDAAVRQAAEGVAHRIVADAVREAVDEARRRLQESPGGTESPAGKESPAEAAPAEDLREAIAKRAVERIRAAARPHYRRVVNATGIILHSGLGRAVLGPKALEAVRRELAGYSLLQLDTETGERSRRDGRIEALLRQLTGAEAATVVNNNAAGTAIALNTLAKGREVIVSRGQLIEIGGSFRLPDVMAWSGVRMVEVGTTNKTHARDYEQAVTPDTAAIIRVHPSNYRIYGFTEEVALARLVEIAHARGLVVIDDIGAGALVDFSALGFRDEPTIQQSLRAGADIVLCSTDKLIGASQGGLVLGKADLVAAVRKNPMARVVRVGKLTLSVLEATLAAFLDEATALREVPTLEMITRGLEAVGAQAARIAAALGERAAGAAVAVVDGASQTGGGSLPTQDIPTRLVAVTPRRMAADALALALRRWEPPVFARIHGDQVLLDPRTLREGDEEVLVAAMAAALAADAGGCHGG
jgi:L-seryl-tRNA(Ser) seleniumtransferase